MTDAKDGYEFPYDRAAYQQRWLDGLAQLDNGEPAWPVANANGIALKTFRQRLARGWSGERAATEPPREDRPIKSKPVSGGGDLAALEAEALANGITRRAFRARVRAGHPPHLAAMRSM